METTITRNHVIAAIDAGHFSRTKPAEKKGEPDVTLCRHDSEVWPCRAILAARKKNAGQYLSLRGSVAATPKAVRL